MTYKPIKIGIVGCGRISHRHVTAIKELNDLATLIAVCDLEEERARQYNCPYYLDYHEMMSNHPEIELVHVLVPTGYHAPVVIDLAKYGRHILVEKPMALTIEDCSRMNQACYINGGKLFVVYQNRYNEAIQTAKLAFDQGRFGKISLASVRVHWCRTQDYYDRDNWRGTWELDGGVMSQQASHHLDLLTYFLGGVESVVCHSSTSLLNIEVEDTAAAILKFKSGALGVFEATVTARPKDFEASLSILGSKGSLVVSGIAVNKIETWCFEENNKEDETANIDHSQVVPNVYGLGHSGYIADLIQYLRTGERRNGICNGYSGQENVKLLAALYESAATNGQLVIPGSEIKVSPLGRKKCMADYCICEAIK